MISIAIDGPSGAGKSTISRAVAARIGFLYVDTGALYRAIGLFAHKNGIPDNDEAALSPHLAKADIELGYKNGVQRVYLSGEDVSEEIRSPELSMAASNVSALPAVRAFLLDLQRQIAERHNVIMDGRDIGTVVLPGADLKIFLTASAEDRARRRHDEYVAGGKKIGYDQVLEDMKKRDYNDSHRAAAPLAQADDAVLAETTGNTLEQSIELILKIIKDRGIA